MEKKSNGELAFLDFLLKQNKEKISELVNRKPRHTDQYLYYISHTIKQVARRVLFPPCLIRAYSIITNKDDLNKENARIKQVLKENEYQKSIISKIFKRATNNHNLFPSKQQTQATDIHEEEIRMNSHSDLFLLDICDLRLLLWLKQGVIVSSSKVLVKNYGIYLKSHKIHFLHWKNFA